MAAKSGFELLLEALPDEEFEFKGPVKQAMVALADKVPKIRDSVLAQSEFSRKMDEVRDKVTLADQWVTWKQNNWLDDQRMTKSELAKQQRLAELEQELEAARQAALAGGGEMTFEQLNQALAEFKTKEGILTKADLDSTIKAKEVDLQNYVKGNAGGMFHAAMVASELNLKHMKEFGEPFDQVDFVKQATDRGRFDLKDFYEKDFVVTKRNEKLLADHKAELEKAELDKQAAIKETEARVKADILKSQTMGANGNMVDMGVQEQGALQKMLATPASGDGTNAGGEEKVPNIPIGEGGIAAFAARQFLQKQAGARSA